MATLRAATCPEEVLDWIAWYAEPELPSEVRSAIDRHAAECLACREELGWIQTEVSEHGDNGPRGERVVAQLMARIRQPETLQAPATTRHRPRGQATPWLAAAAAALILLGGAWLGTRLAVPQPLHTATAGAPPVAAGPALEVLFRDDASWAAIRSTLERADARLASGTAQAPSGRLRLVLPPSTDPAAALGVLRESGLTLFAERAVR